MNDRRYQMLQVLLWLIMLHVVPETLWWKLLAAAGLICSGILWVISEIEERKWFK